MPYKSIALLLFLVYDTNYFFKVSNTKVSQLITKNNYKYLTGQSLGSLNGGGKWSVIKKCCYDKRIVICHGRKF